MTLILTLFVACVPFVAQGQAMRMQVQQIEAAGVVLDGVRAQLDWPAQAPEGWLQLSVDRVDAAQLGWQLNAVDWQCPLRRGRADQGGWQCAGPVRSDEGNGFELAISLTPDSTSAALSAGSARAVLARTSAAPDAASIDLRGVPVRWLEALVQSAWADARATGGEVNGPVRLDAPPAGPVRLVADLAVTDVALDSADGLVAVGGLDAAAAVHATLARDGLKAEVEGALHGGEFLVGNGYVVLPDTPVSIGVRLVQGHDGGWEIPRASWGDGDVLQVSGHGRFGPDLTMRTLSLQLSSDDAAPLAGRYLSGWLGPGGLAGLSMEGGFQAQLELDSPGLQHADLELHRLDVADAEGRFAFEGLVGALRYSAGEPVRSAFAWRSGALYGMPFDAAAWSLESAAGQVHLREPVAFSWLGGEVGFEALHAIPPDAGQGLRIQTSFWLDRLDLGALATALGWPAFEGSIGGRIPTVRYADNRIDFDGGLGMQVFDGLVDVSALSIERPFGVLPTVSADLSLQGLDLHALTGVLGFGSIEGRLDGRIDGLRMVDWNATAFDARLQTRPMPGQPQRISQRAVQDISSVGDASFASTLQGRALALFDDFGYRNIGIGCRLRNGVCRMDGLRSAGDRFTIVDGAGLPRLDVIGFNRDVDWATLLERLAAAADGELAPVIE